MNTTILARAGFKHPVETRGAGVCDCRAERGGVESAWKSDYSCRITPLCSLHVGRVDGKRPPRGCAPVFASRSPGSAL